MNVFHSKALASETAHLLQRLTGDTCKVLEMVSKRGSMTYKIVRYDFTGKMVVA